MRRGLPVLMPLYAKKRWVTVSAGKDAGGRISALSAFYRIFKFAGKLLVGNNFPALFQGHHSYIWSVLFYQHIFWNELLLKRRYYLDWDICPSYAHLLISILVHEYTISCRRKNSKRVSANVLVHWKIIRYNRFTHTSQSSFYAQGFCSQYTSW